MNRSAASSILPYGDLDPLKTDCLNGVTSSKVGGWEGAHWLLSQSYERLEMC